jgi:hypothetical protein
MSFSTAHYYHSSELKKMSHGRRNTVVPSCHFLFSFYLKIQFFYAFLNGWNARTSYNLLLGEQLTLFMTLASGIHNLLGVAHLFSDLFEL